MAQLNDLIVTGASRFLNTINGKITNASTADHVTWGNVSGKPGTYAPIVGTASTQAAKGDHTHDISIATSTGTNQLTLSANTKYALTAGGKSYIFTTPPDTNTTYSLSSLGIGNVKNYDQSKAIKSITRNGLTFTATALDGTTSSFTQQDTNTTYSLSTLGIGNVKNYDQSKAIKSITRSGVNFTATALDGSTFTFNQQDSNTTYSNVSTVAAGLAPKVTSTSAYLRGDGTWATPTNTTYSTFTSTANGLAPASGGGTTKYLRADGSWQVPPDTNTTYSLSTLGIGNVKNYDQSKAIKTITRSGLTFTATALDGTTSSFTQQDTNTTYSFSNTGPTLSWGNTSTVGTVGGVALTVKMPANPNTNTTYSASTGLTLSGTAFSINANASTCTAAKGAADGADFDFGEI